MALQADGKIVVVGSGADGDFALARYNPNGSLDTSFSGDGRQTTDFGGFDQATGVALQGDGKIVAVGGGGADDDVALARYNPNGSLDPSFSGDGRQMTDFGGFDDANGVALQADGKIVAVGRAPEGDFALARYTANGSLDPTFSGDGKQTTDFGGFGEGATGVALLGDGKIVAVGDGGPDFFAGDFALARYNPNGSLDPSFSGDGKQTTDFGDFDRARGVALQGDGKIVAVGMAFSVDNNFALARYNPNGSLDPTFSGDGKQTTDFGGFDQANGVALRGDGKIVVVGDAGGFPSDFALARYNPDGSLDTSLSGDGQQTTDFGGDSDAAFGVALQGDGKIVAVGGGGADEDFALARYLRTGAAVEAGDDFTCGANHNGTLACWGSNAFGKATPPPGTFTAVSAGGDHACGVRTNGVLACWGRNGFGQANEPPGAFTAVSAGFAHTCGISTNGTLVCRGRDGSGQATPPAGAFTAVSAGGFHTCGVRANGTLACWGGGNANPPAGTFAALSAGSFHTCAIRTNGTIACWGQNGFGQANPPAGTFTAVGAGGLHTCGVRTNGAVACWGRDTLARRRRPRAPSPLWAPAASTPAG